MDESTEDTVNEIKPEADSGISNDDNMEVDEEESKETEAKSENINKMRQKLTKKSF